MLAQGHTFVNHSSAFCGTLYVFAASCKSATNEGQTDSKSAREVFRFAIVAAVLGTKNKLRPHRLALCLELFVLIPQLSAAQDWSEWSSGQSRGKVVPAKETREPQSLGGRRLPEMTKHCCKSLAVWLLKNVCNLTNTAPATTADLHV